MNRRNPWFWNLATWLWIRDQNKLSSSILQMILLCETCHLDWNRQVSFWNLSSWLKAPLTVREASSYSGARRWQWGHQGAKNSTMACLPFSCKIWDNGVNKMQNTTMIQTNPQRVAWRKPKRTVLCSNWNEPAIFCFAWLVQLVCTINVGIGWTTTWYSCLLKLVYKRFSFLPWACPSCNWNPAHRRWSGRQNPRRRQLKKTNIARAKIISQTMQ